VHLEAENIKAGPEHRAMERGGALDTSGTSDEVDVPAADLDGGGRRCPRRCRTRRGRWYQDEDEHGERRAACVHARKRRDAGDEGVMVHDLKQQEQELEVQ
jgi:hypothetical protein